MDYFKIVEEEKPPLPPHEPFEQIEKTPPPPHKPVKQTWKSRLTVIWLLFLWFVTQFAIGIPMNQHGHFKLWKIALYVLIFAVCVWLVYRWAIKYHLMPKIQLQYFPLGKIAGGVGLMVLTGTISSIIMMLTNTTSTENQTAINAIGETLPPLVFFIMTTSAGFFEELIFRVSLFELLLNKWPKLATLFAFTLFMLAHAPTNFASFMAYGLMSLVLTGLYAKYRNFYLNMSVHFLWNTLVMIVLFTTT